MTVRVSTLPNGLRVATDSMQGVETVSVGVWVKAGTRDESEPINGIAHLLEHMAFKGTERRSAQKIAEEIEAVGGYLNAHTAREHTAYYAKVLKEDVGLAVDILADILQNSVLTDAEVARERAVVIQEIGQAYDTPDDIIFDHFQEAAFPGQALGRPVLGTEETVAKMDRGTIAAYMREQYTPERMVVAAAGRIEHEKFVALAAEAFQALRGNGNGRAAAPALYAGGERREPRELEQVHLVLGFPGIHYGESDYYTQSLLATLLGGGMSSRLFQEVRERRGLAYSIFSFAAPYTDCGLFGVYAGTSERDAPELLSVVCGEMRRVGDSVSDEELERARAQARAAVLMTRESTSARCEHLATQLLIFGRPIPVNEITAKINGVDRAAISRVAGRLMAGKPSFAALGPLSSVEAYDRLTARLA